VVVSNRQKLARQGVVVVGALIIGAASGFAVALTRSSSVTARTTVFVTRGLPDVAGGDVNTAVADFQTALHLPEVDAAVGRQVHLPASAIHHGIGFSRVLTSSAVRVSFSNAQESVASAVVVSASHQALLVLARPASESATAALSAAQKSYQDALDRLSALDRSLRVGDVANEYAVRSANLANLRNAALSSGSPALAAVVASESALVNRLAAAVPQYQALKAASDSAAVAVASAARSVVNTSGILASVNSSSILTTPVLGPTSRALRLARAAALWGLTAALVVALIIGLLDLRLRRRTLGRRTAAGLRPRVGELGTPAGGLPRVAGSRSQ
jgi:hypothetical protein